MLSKTINAPKKEFFPSPFFNQTNTFIWYTDNLMKSGSRCRSAFRPPYADQQDLVPLHPSPVEPGSPPPGEPPDLGPELPSPIITSHKAAAPVGRRQGCILWPIEHFFLKGCNLLKGTFFLGGGKEKPLKKVRKIEHFNVL